MNGHIVVRRTKGGRWSWRFDVVRRGGGWAVLGSGTAATEADARRAAAAVAFEWECGRLPV